MLVLTAFSFLRKSSLKVCNGELIFEILVLALTHFKAMYEMSAVGGGTSGRVSRAQFLDDGP